MFIMFAEAVPAAAPATAYLGTANFVCIYLVHQTFILSTI